MADTLFCRLRNELDRKYAPIRMQFECSQQIVWKGITVEGCRYAGMLMQAVDGC